jgi:uncharacterized membrane protein
MLPSFKAYYQLALGGLFYNLAIWIDKLIMWFAPERVMLKSKMAFYPEYDSAMFLAYVTIVPAMAVFFFSVETNFFQHYRRFYDDILEHKPLSRIKENGKAMMDSVIYHARTFMVAQGAITFIAIVLAADILQAVNFSYSQVSIFRLGALGGMLHVLALFEMIILSYFDSRSKVMWLQLLFLVSNAIFTIISINMGFTYYGYGYFLSSALTFFVTTLVLFSFLNKVHYHAFITHNNAVRLS